VTGCRFTCEISDDAGRLAPVTAAIREAAGTLDFVSAFRMGHAAAPARA
jgi:hypothetical protein